MHSGAWALDGGEGNNNSSSSSKCAFTSPYTPGATQVLYASCSSHSNLTKQVLALPLSLRLWKHRQLTSLTSSPSVCPPPHPHPTNSSGYLDFSPTALVLIFKAFSSWTQSLHSQTPEKIS